MAASRTLTEAGWTTPRKTARAHLQRFTGIGQVGSDVFLREVQAAWGEFVTRLVAALVRSGLAEDHDDLLGESIRPTMGPVARNQASGHDVGVTERSPVEPMLATTGDRPVAGSGWVFEPKLDGIRLLAARDGVGVRLLTRNGRDHTDRYPELVDALMVQPCAEFVADGEVVAFDGNLTSFQRLQGRSGLRGDAARRSSVTVHLYLFDLLAVDGEDLRASPLLERKERLRTAFEFADPLRYCTHSAGNGPELLEHACRAGWEGLIAKRADSRYRSGRSANWLKLKCVADQELVIGGFTDPKGNRSRFGSLLVGHHDADGLRFAGRVGTGFDQRSLERLGDLLEARERPDSPFVDPPTGRDLHWVRPDLVCQVGFTEWTSSGRLRHPRFLGLRDDKPASEIRRDTP